jgi:hypothetical protein
MVFSSLCVFAAGDVLERWRRKESVPFLLYCQVNTIVMSQDTYKTRRAAHKNINVACAERNVPFSQDGVGDSPICDNTVPL